jgi:hypothetical protein
MSPADRAARERRLARAVRSGVPIRDAARASGVSEDEARRICDAMGVGRKGRKTPRRPEPPEAA